MGENARDVFGPRGARDADAHETRSTGAVAQHEPVEAYEEDWYRSLRALAERQQEMGQLTREHLESLEEEPEGPPPREGLGVGSPEPEPGPSTDAEPSATGPVEDPTFVSSRGDDGPASDETDAGPVDEGSLEDMAPVGGSDGPEGPPTAAADAGWDTAGEAIGEPADGTPPGSGPRRAGTEAADGTPVEAEPLATERPDESVDDGPGPGDGSPDARSELPGEEPGAWIADAPHETADTLEGVAVLELGALAAGEPNDREPAPWATSDQVPVEPPGPSLASSDPHERHRALEELATRDVSGSEAELVAALLFDPDADIRLEALRILARRPDRVEEVTLAQALQDPSDEVRAAAVDLSISRDPHHLEPLVPLLAARAWPMTHRTVLDHLPEALASSNVDDDLLGRVLDAVGLMDPGPSHDERPAMSRLAHALGISRILGCLDASDVRRLGAVRLLADDRSSAVLRALASRGADPVEEIRRAAAAAIEELAEAQAEPPPSLPMASDADEQDTEGDAARISSLARALHDEDPTVRHLALSGLAGLDRAAMVAWVHDTIRGGDASQLALAASTAKVLRLVEGAADILDAAAELPADARHPLVEALTSFVMPPDQLAGLLAQVREPVRAEAIRMLWHVGGAPLLPHLRAHVEDPSEQVRAAVLEAFGDSGDAAAAEVAQTVLASDASARVRAKAVRVLARAAGAPPVDTVVRALSDPDAEVRAIAIESLPDADGAEAIDVLVSSLSDPEDRVRKAAAKRLASRGDPELVWSALRMAPAAGRGEIVGSFERARPGSLTQVALRRLLSPEEEERVLAVEVAGLGSSPGCVEGAIQALQDPAAPVRRAAAEALGRLHEPAAAKALGKALGDPDPEVRMGVVRALGVIDDEGVLGFLVSALNDPDPGVREVTSRVLTEWSSPAVAKRLAGVLAVPSLRDAATDLLTRIGPPAVELLIEVLMQHNPAVAPTVGQLLRRIAEPSEFASRLEAVEPERRLRGLEALGAIGGSEAADALLRSVSDPDERIRVRAAQLLAGSATPALERS